MLPDDDYDDSDNCRWHGHHWKTTRSEGDPAEGYEMITYCTRCGTEQMDESGGDSKDGA